MATTAPPAHCSPPVALGTGREGSAARALAVTGVALVVASMARTTPAILIAPMESLGWDRGALAAVAALNLLAFGLAGPFGAALARGIGLRATLAVALTATAAATALGVAADSAWSLALAWGIGLGAAAGLLAVPLAAVAALRCAPGRTGLWVGVATALTGAAQLVALPGVAWIAVGRGPAAAALAAAVAALAALCLVPLVPRAAPGRPAGPGALAGLRIAARSRVFWTLAALMAACGAATQGLVGTHLVPAVHDHGVPEVVGAGLLAVMGGLTVAGGMGAGWAADRWDPARLLFVLFAARALMLVMLPVVLAGRGLGLVAVVVVFGLDWAATVPPVAAIARREAGDDGAAVMLGWILVAHHAGAALGALGGGLSESLLGSYVLAFMGAGLVSLSAAVLALALWRRPRAMPAPAPEPA